MAGWAGAEKGAGAPAAVHRGQPGGQRGCVLVHHAAEFARHRGQVGVLDAAVFERDVAQDIQAVHVLAHAELDVWNGGQVEHACR